VIQAALQQLMRHSEIETTLSSYYVGTDAEAMGDLLYAAVPKPPKGDSTVAEAKSELPQTSEA
jgi:hypothetical protein